MFVKNLRTIKRNYSRHAEMSKSNEIKNSVDIILNKQTITIVPIKHLHPLYVKKRTVENLKKKLSKGPKLIYKNVDLLKN